MIRVLLFLCRLSVLFVVVVFLIFVLVHVLAECGCHCVSLNLLLFVFVVEGLVWQSVVVLVCVVLKYLEVDLVIILVVILVYFLDSRDHFVEG